MYGMNGQPMQVFFVREKDAQHGPENKAADHSGEAIKPGVDFEIAPRFQPVLKEARKHERDHCRHAPRPSIKYREHKQAAPVRHQTGQ